MSRTREVLGYVATGMGMALACTNLVVLVDIQHQTAHAWLAVVLSGVLALLIAAGIAEAASVYPSSPGVRVYVRAAFGDRTSLATTFLLLLVVVLFASVESYFLGAAVAVLYPALSPLLVSSVLIVSVTLVNLRGVEFPLILQSGACVVLVALLAAVTLSGLSASPAAAATLSRAPSTADSMLGAMGSALFVYTGFEWIAMLGRRPQSYVRRIPAGLIGSVVALTLLEGGFAAALERHFPGGAGLGFVPHVALAGQLWGKVGVTLMVVVSVLCVITTFNAGVLGMSRLVFAVAREGVLPKWLRQVTPTGVPANGVLAVGVSALLASFVVAAFGAYELVAIACAAGYCLVYGVLMLSVAKLRVSPHFKPSFRAPAPTWAFGALGIALFGLGILTAVSLPGQAFLTLGITACCLFVAVIGSVTLGRRATRLSASRA